MQKIENLFEVSWEVCNKVGGINTVIATKAEEIQRELGDNYILIGPDLLQGEEENLSFVEDKTLFPEWKNELLEEGINLRIGRWDNDVNPIAILLDYTYLYEKKDEIFTHLWNEYNLDSLSGQWDYIEPALFGYASGMIIKSFADFYFGTSVKVAAHFHEWMAGAGVLFLKEKAPNIATIFTTHATILGRTLAGNNVKLYDSLNAIQPIVEAARYNVMSKFSMEKTVAANADVFTTVSQITADECEAILKKKPDIVTPNGFNLDFLPSKENFSQRKEESRKKILQAAKNVLGYDVDKSSYLILSSGRYEFKNKGIDVLINALFELRNQDMKEEVIVFIAVPADSGEVHPLVQRRLEGDFSDPTPGNLTHRIFDPTHDPILNALNTRGFGNEKNAKIKVIFAPVYLNGNDGLINLDYYDFLLGFDLTAFPSYYEPWGYTPMESTAFKIPTITSNLAGFGSWISESINKGNKGASVVIRDDYNYNDAVKNIASSIDFYIKNREIASIAEDASVLSQKALWSNLVQHYFSAYEQAIYKAEARFELLDKSFFVEKGRKFIDVRQTTPQWKKAFIAPKISKNLEPLMKLAKNLWWTWNYNAASMFKSINPEKWKTVKYNPIELIESLTYSELVELENNTAFIQRLNEVYADFDAYMQKAPTSSLGKIAYFSMEFGIHDTVKIFSGGLGILAGDYLKEISDKNINLVGAGLLYRYGYFKQKLTETGNQIADSKAQKFTHMPIQPVRDKKGNWLHIEIGFPGRIVKAKIWVLHVGRVNLYLLDTDIDENTPVDRAITHHLYGGGHENRLRQEILLGVGGVRMLNLVEEHPQIFHLNEGHAAMAGLERLRELIKNNNLSFAEALEVVRASSLFTTHTPVPAGHDRFDETLMRKYIPHYADRLKLSWEDFMALGKVNKMDRQEQFSMSNLAAKLSQEMNGVSKIHGEVSREMFSNLFPGYAPEELYIGHVTNGVHLPTWAAKAWQITYKERIDKDFMENQNNLNLWKKLETLPDEEIWNQRQHQRARLIADLKRRLTVQFTKRSVNPKEMIKIVNALDDKTLTIGFARRFATYKRAHLLFSNLDRLDKLVNNKKKPIQFIFAGKAHPADQAGQDLIRRIVEISKMPQFVGKIVFVADYDINLGKKLTQGVDVWLNNPTRPLEASGTSGEKAVMNGVMNLSVLDGWWAEGYVEGAGWALEEERTYGDQQLQDELDAANIYRLIEEEVKPKFYDRNQNGVPVTWVRMIKKNFAEIAPHFTMNRMVDDYVDLYYTPLFERSFDLEANDFAEAKEIVKWKDHISNSWKQIIVEKLVYPDTTNNPIQLGDSFDVEVWLNNVEEIVDDIKVEFVTATIDGNNVKRSYNASTLKLSSVDGNIAKYSGHVVISHAGVINFAFRVYPWNDKLPHRQDFPLVEWI